MDAETLVRPVVEGAGLQLVADPRDHLVEHLVERRRGLEAEDALRLRRVGHTQLNVVREGLVLTVGQHNNFQSLEELTSSRFSSFIERAAFTDAFNDIHMGITAEEIVTRFKISRDDQDAFAVLTRMPPRCVTWK